MATVAKGYDLDYAWRAVGEAYRGAGYYLAAAEAGEPPGTWWGPGAERLGFSRGQVVERDGIYFAPGAVARAAEVVAGLLARQPAGVTASEVREALGTTRKYLLPLLGHLDATGVTRRRGELRIGGPRLPPTEG